MLIIGLTGGIGSGKSTAANFFAALGVPIIDADVSAREVVKPGMPALKMLTQHFGKDILDHHGELDRVKLRQIIFRDPNERLWLEKLLHPLIIEDMKKKLTIVDAPYCIAIVPLLTEVKVDLPIDRILVIEAPDTLQKDRTLQRDKVLEEEFIAISKSQAKSHERLATAHDVIHNDQTLKELKKQVENLHQVYSKLAGTK